MTNLEYKMYSMITKQLNFKVTAYKSTQPRANTHRQSLETPESSWRWSSQSTHAGQITHANQIAYASQITYAGHSQLNNYNR